MTSIAAIRQKYPDYNDLSDQQLVDALHSKHYSDMPKDEFYSKVGFKQEPQKSALQNATQYLKSDVTNLGKNLTTGFLNMGRNFANFPHHLGSKVGLGDVFAPLAPENYNYAEALGLPKESENRVAQAIPELAVSLAIPGSTIPRIIAGQAVLGATQNKNPLLGAVEGAGGALVGTVIGKGIEKGINALRPSKLFRGELSPEELTKNLEITKGTESPLGRVIESPWLQRLQENILPHVIGSGAEKTMQKTAKTVTEKGEKILHDLRGGEEVHENYGEKIKSSLQEAAKKAEQEKTNKFSQVNNIAEKEGVTTNRSNLKKEAASILAQVKSDPDLAQFTNTKDIQLLKEIINPSKKTGEPEFATKMRNIKNVTETPNYKGRIDLTTGRPIESITKEKNISLHVPRPKSNERVNVITGQPINEPASHSLKNTDILRGKIGEHAYEAKVKGEKPKAAIYSRLKQALENDVNEAIEKSSHPELKKAHKEAMDFYKNEYAPFKDKDVNKFIQNGGDPDLLLGHFVRMGKADRVHILRKLKLSEGKEGLVGNAYLSPAYENGSLNPVKLNTLYQKLGKRQRVELFGKEHNEKLKNYTDLVHKNKEAFNLMFNPKTGARLGHVGSLVAAGSHLPAVLGLGAAGNVANKLLTNESFREKLIKAMIESKDIKLPKSMKALLKTGGTVLNNSNRD